MITTPKRFDINNPVPITFGINPVIKNTIPVLAGLLRACPELVEGKDAKIMTKPAKKKPLKYKNINR